MLKTVEQLGPTLPKLKWWEKHWQIIKFAFSNQTLPIFIMLSFFAAILVLTFSWNELRFPLTTSYAPKSLIEWLLNAQTILGMGTLLVALFVWHGEIEEDWENDLPKRLSVFFFWKGKPLIVCRYVWLAGSDEIRTWGQQVALQAQDAKPGESLNDLKLNFGPDMETKKSELVLGPNGKVWKHYSICFRLTGLNRSLERTKECCRYQNLAAKDVDADNFEMEAVESLPEVDSWKRILKQNRHV